MDPEPDLGAGLGDERTDREVAAPMGSALQERQGMVRVRAGRFGPSIKRGGSVGWVKPAGNQRPVGQEAAGADGQAGGRVGQVGGPLTETPLIDHGTVNHGHQALVDVEVQDTVRWVRGRD